MFVSRNAGGGSARVRFCAEMTTDQPIAPPRSTPRSVSATARWWMEDEAAGNAPPFVLRGWGAVRSWACGYTTREVTRREGADDCWTLCPQLGAHA